MGAQIRLRDQEFEIRPGMTIRDAMLKCGIQPESVIPTISGELVIEDEIVRDGDEIRLISVISGG
jgi:sulfur carrier protein ThiS